MAHKLNFCGAHFAAGLRTLLVNGHVALMADENLKAVAMLGQHAGRLVQAGCCSLERVFAWLLEKDEGTSADSSMVDACQAGPFFGAAAKLALEGGVALHDQGFDLTLLYPSWDQPSAQELARHGLA